MKIKSVNPYTEEVMSEFELMTLKDAGMDDTAAMAVNARMVNGGQSCIASKLFIVVDEAVVVKK